MIPKFVHQCWFGPKPLPESHRRYMEGVRAAMPDFGHRLWTNDDLPDTRFVRECLAWGKYALLSDYMRLKIVSEYGGIYMDTDVEVFKSLAPLLDCACFVGFSQDVSERKPVSNTIVAAEAGNDFVEECLSELVWEMNHRLKPAYGVKVGNRVLFRRGLSRLEAQTLGSVRILDRDVLYREYCQHHFAGSWHSKNNARAQLAALGYRSVRAANLLWGGLLRKRMYG